MSFFKFLSLQYDQLTDQVNLYLRDVYNKSDRTYDSSSPYGQIINTIKEFFRFNILSQKKAIDSMIISKSNNKKVINSLARIGGHNPSRPMSATGTLVLKVKPGVDNNTITGGKIIIGDYFLLRNKSNGLNYTLRLGEKEKQYKVEQNSDIEIFIVQGKFETQTFTGDGEKNQSFNINIPNQSLIDQYNIEVKYNDMYVEIKDNIFDMLRNEMSCIVKTGMNGGIDIYFGNGDFGFIPDIGSVISVTYLLTDGTNGNILTPQLNDFDYVDSVTDINGKSIDVDSNFDTYIKTKINFASDGETIEFTKSIMPYVSRNFVLATPSQYIYTLKKLNLFSKINVYNTLTDNNFTNDSKIYLFLVPKLSNYYSNGVNYFNLPLDYFKFDSVDKIKIESYLRFMASIAIGTEIKIIDPEIVRYVMNVYVRKFKGYSNDNLKTEILTKISTYLTELQRDDRIPKSDIIYILESIKGIDSVNISFICEDSITYTKDGINVVNGLDPVQGDIVVDKSQLAVIRGGWTDFNGVYYDDVENENNPSSINIIFTGETEKNINNYE